MGNEWLFGKVSGLSRELMEVCENMFYRFSANNAPLEQGFRVDAISSLEAD